MASKAVTTPHKQSQRSARPRVLSFMIAVLIASNRHPTAMAKPYRLIVSSKKTCAHTSLVPGIKYKIEYSAPDVDLSQDKDMTLEVLPTPEHAHNNNNNNMPLLSQTLDQKEGSVMLPNEHGHTEEHHNHEHYVDICVQAIMATRQNPRRIFFRLLEVMDVVEFKAPDQTHVVDRLARMEYEVERMAQEAEYIMAVAELSYDQSKHLHRQSNKMHSASRWWPMLQILILCGATVMQARYMMSYLSKRHVF